MTELRVLEMLEAAMKKVVRDVEQLAYDRTSASKASSLHALKALKKLLQEVEQQVKMIEV